MECLHCRASPASRPRGLCYRCYDTLRIRAPYPPIRKKSRRGIKCRRGIAPNYNGLSTLPEGPTEALPGTPEKIAVLSERARQLTGLWHREDRGTCLE